MTEARRVQAEDVKEAVEDAKADASTPEVKDKLEQTEPSVGNPSVAQKQVVKDAAKGARAQAKAEAKEADKASGAKAVYAAVDVGRLRAGERLDGRDDVPEEVVENLLARRLAYAQ